MGTCNSHGTLLVYPTSDILNSFCGRLNEVQNAAAHADCRAEKLTAGRLVWAARLWSLFVFNFLPKGDHDFRGTLFDYINTLEAAGRFTDRFPDLTVVLLSAELGDGFDLTGRRKSLGYPKHP